MPETFSHSSQEDVVHDFDNNLAIKKHFGKAKNVRKVTKIKVNGDGK